MGKFDGVLIATDLDDTLLNSKHILSDENREAIEYFISNGGRFTVVTGRSPMAFEVIRSVCPINAPVLLSNGGVLFDYSENKLVYAEYLDEYAKSAVQAIMAEFPSVGVEIHTLGKKFCINRNRAIDSHEVRIHCSMTDIENLSQAEEDWIKALFVDENELLLKLAEWAGEKYGETLSMVFSSATLYELQNKDTTKGGSLLRLAEFLGIDNKNVYSAGDNQNDISMLKAVESFAPENATNEVKAVVSHMMPDCDHHTMAAIIAFLDERYA